MTLNEIRQIAINAHHGQIRRGGKPYFSHVADVARRVVGEDAKTVAYLHDVLEDTAVVEKDLLKYGVRHDLVEVVKVLIKGQGEKYADYIDRIAQNRLAVNVKIADIISNISDDPTNAQIRKYGAALVVLAGKTEWV